MCSVPIHLVLMNRFVLWCFVVVWFQSDVSPRILCFTFVLLIKIVLLHSLLAVNYIFTDLNTVFSYLVHPSSAWWERSGLSRDFDHNISTSSPDPAIKGVGHPVPPHGVQTSSQRLRGPGELWEGHPWRHAQLQLLSDHRRYGRSLQVYQTHQEVRRQYVHYICQLSGVCEERRRAGWHACFGHIPLFDCCHHFCQQHFPQGL